MIFRRSPLSLLGILLALVASATTGRAEPEPHASAATTHPATPADADKHSAAAVEEPKHVQPANGDAAHGVVNETPPGHSDTGGTSSTNHADKAGETEHATPLAGPSHATEEGNREEILSLQKLGTSLTERNDWAAAEIAFRQIMGSRQAKDDDLANALFGLARVYRKSGAYTKAAAIYEKFIKSYPTNEQVPDALLELGRTHRALGAHKLALTRFYNVINSTLKLSSEGFAHYQMLAKTAQFEIAETHFMLGNYDEANKYFSRLRLLDLAPADRARAHFKSAYALYLGKNLGEAVTTLRSYLEQWPLDENVPEARYLLSLSLRSLGRKQEAMDATLQLLRNQQAGTDPKRWSYWQRRTGNQLANEFFQSGDTFNALSIYQGLVALSPEPAWRLPITYQIALCYERMRLDDQAAAAYQSIIDNANPPTTATVGPKAEPNTELVELARMATWRLGQLNWHANTDRQLSVIFTPDSKPIPKPAPALQPFAPNIENTAPSQPAATPAYDQSGKPEPASTNL